MYHNNNQAPEYLKCMLLSQSTDCDKRTRQDYEYNDTQAVLIMALYPQQ